MLKKHRRHHFTLFLAVLFGLGAASDVASADVGWHCDQKKAVKQKGDEFPSLFSMDGGETFTGHLYSYFKVRPGPGIISEAEPPPPTLVHDIEVMPIPNSDSCTLQIKGNLADGRWAGANLVFDKTDDPNHMKVSVSRRVMIPDGNGQFVSEVRTDEVECSFTGKFKEMVKTCAVPTAAKIEHLMTCTSDAAVGPQFEKGFVGSTFSLELETNESVGQAGIQLSVVSPDGTRVSRGGREMKVTAQEKGGSCVLNFSEKDQENSMTFQLNKTDADQSGGSVNLNNFKATTYVRDEGIQTWESVFSHYHCKLAAPMAAHVSNCQFIFENGATQDDGSGTRQY